MIEAENWTLNTVEEALNALRKGEMIVVTDDEDRENEGDLVCAAEFATPEAINFMATHAKGLICMPMTAHDAERFKLQPMVSRNTDNHQTAFTVSIDHVATTTGISAGERSLTVMKFVEEGAKAEDFRRPGHMFPLVAKDNGVLERNGHTEATVDLMKLAGLKPCGLCCEMIREDGEMMRMPEVVAFARQWQLKMITIKDLQHYRKCHDQVVKCVAAPVIDTVYGAFKAYGYENLLNGEHHVAWVKGPIGNGEDVLCRVHSECLTGDVFHSMRCDCGDQLKRSMQMIEKEGRGILLYMRQEGRGIGLLNKLKAYELQSQGMDTVEANLALGFEEDLREYFICSQILKDIGVKTLNLMTNNPDKVSQLEAFGIHVTKRVPIEIKPHKGDEAYLKTKKEKMGHYLESI